MGYQLQGPEVEDHSQHRVEVMTEAEPPGLVGLRASSTVASRTAMVTFSLPGLPTVSMVECKVLLERGATRIEVSVMLQGQSTAAITALVQLQRRNTSKPLLFPGGGAPEVELRWPPGASGARKASFTLPENGAASSLGDHTGIPASEQAQEYRLVLMEAVNAEIGDPGETVAFQRQFRPMFGVVGPPKVLFAEDLLHIQAPNGTVTVDLEVALMLDGADRGLLEPAVIIPKLVVETLEWEGLAMIDKDLQVLHWNPCGVKDSVLIKARQACESQRVQVVILASALTKPAYLRAYLALEPVMGAIVPHKFLSTADLHVIGTPRGVCPPGTVVTRNMTIIAPNTSVAEDTGDGVESLLEATEPADEEAAAAVDLRIWYSGLENSDYVKDADGVVGLSPDFDAMLLSYGIQVPISTSWVELEATMIDGVDNLSLEPLDAYAPSPLQAASDREKVHKKAEKLEADGNKAQNQLAARPRRQAWHLTLQVGKNLFRIRAEMKKTDGDHNDTSHAHGISYDLAIVRLANASHLGLDCLLAVSGTDQLQLCGSRCAWETLHTSGSKHFELSGDSPSTIGLAVPPCTPGSIYDVYVSAVQSDLMLQPQLMWPDAAGITVEVGSSILQPLASMGSNARFPPVRIFLGSATEIYVDVTVAAEDQVTTATYTVRIQRLPLTSAQDLQGNSFLVMVPDPLEQKAHGIPGPANGSFSPEQLLPESVAAAGCEACGAGYYAGGANSRRCNLCPPGSHSPPIAGRCYPCTPGTFAPTWGSPKCRPCATGTYSSGPNARACQLCPANMTTPGSGGESCSVALNTTDLSRDYAVVVQLSVAFLVNTSDINGVSLRTALDGTAEAVVAYLIRMDTATVFGISIGDVAVDLKILNLTAASLSSFMAQPVLPTLLLVGNMTSDDATELMERKNASAGGPPSRKDKLFTRPPETEPGTLKLAHFYSEHKEVASVTSNLSAQLPPGQKSAYHSTEMSSLWDLLENSTGKIVNRRVLTANVTATLAADVDLSHDQMEDIDAKVICNPSLI